MLRLVNIIPATWSDDANQDCEPGLTVNPANPDEMVATAFTFDNPAGTSAFSPAMTGSLAPVYYSTDGGETWTLSKIVPSSAGAGIPTNDITARFGGSSGVLYSGIISFAPGQDTPILRAPDPLSPLAMLVDRSADQPFVQAATALGGNGAGTDRVYVPYNQGGAASTVDFSLDAAATPAPAWFNPVGLDVRPGALQDSPATRAAIHPDGTIYAAFYRIIGVDDPVFPTLVTAEVVVVHDNYWGTGSPPFADLKNIPGDGLAGRIITPAGGITTPWLNFHNPDFGQDRAGLDLSIAVDPTDSQRVYIVYSTGTDATDYTLHVRSSANGGAGWDDRRTISKAKNPSLAINSLGQVGLLYQQVVGPAGSSNWVTRFERTSDDFANFDSFTLASVPANVPVAYAPWGTYLGDYDHLQAIGKNFYGVFCANNTPDPANFPSTAPLYQRNHDFASSKLFGNDGVTEIPASIDPFFFKVTAIEEQDDFYVRDWTDTSLSHDTGVEPSTNPVFYATSDVWNQRSDVAPTFDANDRPIHESPQIAGLGDNFAFVRVHREAAAPPGTPKVDVQTHFLFADFGLGAAYQDMAATPDPTLTFHHGDTEKVLVKGYKWELPAIHSQHVCMAVQISTPTDPYVPPGLLGHAPGWPTTDLMVINDNNKAQRNTGVYELSMGAAGMHISFYAIAHNAATMARDVVVRYHAPDDRDPRLGKARVGVVGGRTRPFRSGDALTLENMQPGENRWISLTLAAPMKHGQAVSVVFEEMLGSTVLNGLTIAVLPSSLSKAIRTNLELHAGVFARIAALFELGEAEQESKAAQELLGKRRLAPKTYLAFLASHARTIGSLVSRARELADGTDPFGMQRSLNEVIRTVKAGDGGSAAVAHAALLHKIDAFLTMLTKTTGDSADILLNVRWQKELYTKAPDLSALSCSGRIVADSTRFIGSYGAREVGDADYPDLIRDVIECFHDTTKAVSGVGLEEDIASLGQSLDSPAAVQKAHRELLLKLQPLMPKPRAIRERRQRGKGHRR
jgi:hypothetical protein